MIIVRIWEGLGNQLFQYAYARALKHFTGMEILLDITHINRTDLPGLSVHDDKKEIFDRREYKLNHYNITLKEAKKEQMKRWKFMERKSLLHKLKYEINKSVLCPGRLLTDEPDTACFHEELLRVKDGSYISGHFFHLNYFDSVKAVLRKELTLKKPLRLSNELKEVLETGNTVGVHIRRGDYMRISNFLGISYYKRSFDYIRAKVDKPVFLFFSDDIEWVKSHVSGRDSYFFVSDGILEDYEELEIMCRCRHNIVANSTFSFWGAWLNDNPDKIIICPPNLLPASISQEWLVI